MATKIDQKAYLQKYLSGPSGDKKKKKKKVTKGRGFKIIDDDLDLSKLRALDGDELDILGEGEDAPQIAGIIDERPEEIRKLEQFQTTSKWRVINEDDGFNSKIQIQEIKKDVKEVEKENELVFGKMYSDSEDEQKENSDLSPPRKQTANENQARKETTKKHLNLSDKDFTPPRRKKEDKATKTKSSKDCDSDVSPPRRKPDSKTSERPKESDLSPPRKNNKSSKRTTKDNHQNSDSDLSQQRKGSISKERVRKTSRWGDFKEEEERYKRLAEKSPLYQRSSRSPDKDKIKNKRNKSSDSDMSPPRKAQRNRSKAYDSDISPPRKASKNSNKNYDSDLSPPRKRKYSPERQKDGTDKMKHRSNDKYSSNNKTSKGHENDRYSTSQNDSRRYSKDYNKIQPTNRNDRNRLNNKRKYNRDSDSPPPSNKKMEKTLDGKKAGLQDAVQLRLENEAFRKREENAFSKMTDEISGRNAQVVSRKGKRETSEERRKQREKVDKQKELDDKYKKWGKGLKQLEDEEKRVQDYMHEAAKPFARHKDDRDLEKSLKGVEREGDPMLRYIREKKRDRGELGPEKPIYKGSFPPNRFNIRPGYRWDGVDRSNGYEKKYFDQLSKRKAQAEEAYKWSTEDL